MNREEKLKYLANFNFPHCNDVSKYTRIAKIGQGTYGEVFKACEKTTGTVVAMKKIRETDDDKEETDETEFCCPQFPNTSLREIRILQKIKHENIIKLIEVCKDRETESKDSLSTFYLIFEFCDHDLAGLVANDNVKFTLAEIKKVLQQLFNGLFYLHNNKILHRDIKTGNILVNKDGTLKIADFGLARPFTTNPISKRKCLTGGVVTIWYRPPELLLGSFEYGPSVDIWSAGCIMAEMWTRFPLMPGGAVQDQINLISCYCGSMTEEVWPGVESIDHRFELPQGLARKVREILVPFVDYPQAYDLLDKLLIIDPRKRLDADGALNHDFFWTDPLPADLGPMLSKLPQSLFEFTIQSHRMIRNISERLQNVPAQDGEPQPSTSQNAADTNFPGGAA